MIASALPTLAEIEAAARVVRQVFQPTPQYRWPLAEQRLGTRCWIKHENHTPVGAFKIRGGLYHFHRLATQGRLPRHVVSATRGNHGQSIGWAARTYGVRCTIVVPHGNSMEKNAAMRALGVDLVEQGDDFQASREYAQALAEATGAYMVPSFHRDLVAGVATYWHELLQAAPEVDVIYVPIGLGSGACAAIAARQALGHRARIVGVISAHATTYADSLAAARVVDAAVHTRLADGMACRRADPEALAILAHGLDRVVQVSDEAVAEGIRTLYHDTHNVAEGAGAAAWAAALQEREQLRGQTVAVVLSGGNIDASMFADVLNRR
ncbi:threonine dehydratase [Tepidicella xavieri]|uniref:Threonine dehydratase n=1 Tax=Tepidicella xavieri TaxID=360241 RepID=A0A4R6UGE9_9BURK|nr:threonine dehydratase [Tepidicella xavieri]TDQ44293.1 threonine dehydratase [Tepidicella xavieri]